MLILLVFIQVIYVCMVYGPIAAYLVEAFPAKVRYTSLSLPYHIGNGVFGGLLPLIGLTICAATGNIYAGLYYPIAVALVTFVVGTTGYERDAGHDGGVPEGQRGLRCTAHVHYFLPERFWSLVTLNSFKVVSALFSA